MGYLSWAPCTQSLTTPQPLSTSQNPPFHFPEEIGTLGDGAVPDVQGALGWANLPGQDTGESEGEGGGLQPHPPPWTMPVAPLEVQVTENPGLKCFLLDVTATSRA